MTVKQLPYPRVLIGATVPLELHDALDDRLSEFQGRKRARVMRSYVIADILAEKIATRCTGDDQVSSVSPFDTRPAKSAYPEDGPSMRAHWEAAKGAELTNSLSRHAAPLFNGGAKKNDQAARKGSSNGIGQTLLIGVGFVAAWDEDAKISPTAPPTSTLHPVAVKTIGLDPLSRSLFSAMLTKADNVGRAKPLDVTSSNVASAFAVSLETASGMIATLSARGLITRSLNSMGGCDGWRVGT